MVGFRSLLIIFSFVFITACNPVGEVGDSASAGSSGGAQPGQSRWNSADFPLSISLANDVSASERVSLSNSLDEWDNAVTGESFFGTTPVVTDPEHSRLQDYRDGTFGIYNVEAADPVQDDSLDVARALAVTQFYAIADGAGFRIIHADIFVNKRYYEFTTVSNPTKYDYDSVVLHEIGHLLGLGHVAFSQGDSVMNPSISTTTEKRTLFGIDDNSINDVYNGSSVSGASVKALSTSNFDEDKVVRVVTQLLPNGECHHFHDGKLTKKH